MIIWGHMNKALLVSDQVINSIAVNLDRYRRRLFDVGLCEVDKILKVIDRLNAHPRLAV